jgi:ubiquinol-cytochrome c reductase cytochrome b subunit
MGAPFLTKVGDVIDERVGHRAAWAAFTGRQLPGAPSFGRALGVLVAALFALVGLSGIGLSFHYAPTMTSAWASTAHIETSVPLGAFIRSLHLHATSALIIAIGLHLAHMFATAAWRRPREASWILGLATALLVALMALTGNFLPLDQDGWHGLQVELEVIASAPLGSHLRALLIGGDDVGNATVTRFHTLHTVILPAVFIALAALHIAIARRRRALAHEVASPEMPGQHLRSLALVGTVFAGLFVVAATVGARLDAPADPAAPFMARPEWYFVVLNQLNTWLGTWGALLVPPAAIGFLFAVPLLDRRPTGRPAPIVLIPAVLLALMTLGLTAFGLISDAGDEKLAKANERATRDAARALETFVRDGVDAEGRLVMLAALDVYREQGCASCHDKEKQAAPRLAGWGTIARTDAFLKDPDDDRFFKHTPLKGSMTAFSGDDEARRNLALYLHHDNGLPADPTATAETLAAGRKAFVDDGCDTCHNDPQMPLHHQKYDLKQPGADVVGYAGPEWTRGVIRNARHPAYYGDAVEEVDFEHLMPAYPDLSEDDLNLLVKWLSAGAPGAK